MFIKVCSIFDIVSAQAPIEDMTPWISAKVSKPAVDVHMHVCAA